MDEKDQMEQLRAATSSLLDKAKDGTVADLASAVEKATGALRLASELEKSRAQVQKLQYENATATKRERSERRKEYATILTPVVTIVTLAATLMVQSLQFSQSEKDKREAAEDTQWGETVKTISQTNKLSPAVITLQPFLNSPKYADRARTTAVELLASSTDQVFFKDLFGAAFVPLDWSNLDHMLKLDIALDAKVDPLRGKTYDLKTRSNDLTKLTSDERALYDYGTSAIDKISANVGSLLKRPRVSDRGIDLSGAYFSYADWRGVDLSGAHIGNCYFSWMDLKGANLSMITEFTGVDFRHSAWWEARLISPELLAYLQENNKCDPQGEYGPRPSQRFTSEECTAQIDRLKHAGTH